MDDRGRPRVLLLSAGNINDISMAEALIQAAGPIRRLLADKGHDADHLRRRLAAQGAEAVIPSTASRRTPIPYDTIAYKDRNRVERMCAGSRTSGASPPDTTSWPETTSPVCSWPQSAPIGSIESGP